MLLAIWSSRWKNLQEKKAVRGKMKPETMRKSFVTILLNYLNHLYSENPQNLPFHESKVLYVS